MGRQGGLLALGLAAVVAVSAAFVPSALAADSVYWADSGSSAIRVGNLNGTGARNLFTGEMDPMGVAIDPAAGKIYWADFGSGTIRVGNLNGTGAHNLFTGESGAMGVTIDAAAGKIYWSDDSSGQIRVGNLNGTGAHNLFTGESGPTGVAIDPATGKIYWGATGSIAIRVGNLNGTGAANLFTPEGSPYGVAIDLAIGDIYWGSFYGDDVRFGKLGGTGAANLFSGEPSAEGVALDPAAGRIYWTQQSSSGKVRVGNLNGTGAADLFTGESNPSFLALLLSPAGSRAPRATGGSSVRSTLSCSQGSWASDLEGASLYQAPQSFAYRWRLNGTPIAGARSSKYRTTRPGGYSCQVTAINYAGSTTQTSTPRAVAGCVVPKLLGRTLNGAKKALKRAYCRLGNVNGPRRGRVTDQKPRPGTVLAPGGKVRVELG
jgi:DNA-binding beta-propeller fold protein YncE